MKRYSFLCCIAFCISSGSTDAHYHMLIPNKSSVKSGDEVIFTYKFGHPFEQDIADAREPESVLVHLPNGKVLDLKDKLSKIEIAGEKGKKQVGFQLAYKPEQRGDHIVVFTAQPVLLDGDKRPVHDTVKVTLHVQTEIRWDSPLAHGKEQRADLIPLTRPYGLRTGMLFRATFYDLAPKPNVAIAPIPHANVEIERYNSETPKDLPPEEHITYTARTDEKGVLAATLPDHGWWAVTAFKSTRSAIYRCTLWVHVDGKIPLKPAD